LIWSLTRNAVIGVSEGFSKKLEINGVGYRASVAGNKLNMNLGFSHPIEYILPLGITATVEGNAITISGVDKQVVGEVAASIRKIRKPEPYKGKGIKYSDEIIRRKAGKAATKGK
jgi:large subunit ribosomal protein L6